MIAPDVPEWLRERKVKLLGLDLPSVDPIEAKKLTNHYALAAARVAIVESLDLSEVEAGIYHFSALPLKIAGAMPGPFAPFFGGIDPLLCAMDVPWLDCLRKDRNCRRTSKRNRNGQSRLWLRYDALHLSGALLIGRNNASQKPLDFAAVICRLASD